MSRTRPAAVLRVRAALAHLVWWGCVGAALILAGAVLLVTLRADGDAQPWAAWFAVADALTPDGLDGAWSREAAWWREPLREELVALSVAAAAWLVGGLVLALLLRPGTKQVARGGARSGGSVTTWSRGEVPSHASPGSTGDANAAPGERD